ncbi:zinc finger protein [Macleaya cordata]|uniref:Zinc finger protein n=1 Tax=Macleaya cordata TaxID=56857 RepID=A0A200PVA5_MACCD|nr:zinc finger protein [Macleaya cordata]
MTDSSSFPALPYRFYPRMKMGHVLASLEIKPGYGVYVTDFDIPKKTMNAQEKIHLFVAQMDNTETSSCIINPPLVNFLLNGKGVDRRTNVIMDNGPQFPTNVTSILKYGTNLLQAIGPFNGNYFIAIVFMSVASSSEAPVLQDYVRPLVAAHNSDSEIIEGSSRISLNCPVSLTRIKTPVKGHLCKHHQCFDYDNFIEINLRRPSWRCPQCDQSVSYTDIRIDQFMAKVLREVGESVADVIISADGSWKRVMESGECTEPLGCQQDWSKQSESSKAAADIVDLTMEEMDDTDARDTWEMEDRKPSVDILQGFSFATNRTLPLEVNNNTSQVVQEAAPQMEDNIWAGILSSCSASFGMASGIAETPAHSMISSMPTDIVALALDRVSGVARGPTERSSTSLHQDQILAPNNSQFLPSQFGNSVVNSEYGSRSSITRNITRTPIAVQALPAQTAPNSHQRSSTSLNSLMPNVTPPVGSQTPLSIQALPAQTVPNSHQWSSTSLNLSMPSVVPPVTSQTPLSVAPNDMASNLVQHHMLTQNRDYQNYDYLQIPSLSSQQVVGLPRTAQNLHQQAPNFRVPQSTTQAPSMVGTSTHLPNHQQAPHLRVSQSMPPTNMAGPSTHFPHHQQAPHLRVPQSTTPPPGMVGPSTRFPQTNIQPGLQGSSSHMSGSYTNMLSRFSAAAHAAAQRASNIARVPPVTPVQLLPARTGSNIPMTNDEISRTTMGEQQRGGNMGGVVQPVLRTEDLVGSLSEQNWRPQGRMRGSLTGRPLPGSLSQLIIQPTQPAQFARPPPDLTSQPVANSSLLGNSMNTQRSHQQSFSMTGDMAG